MTYLNQFVPSLYPAQTNGANDEWWSSGYANTTDVDESNWAIVITNGQVSPANFQISTAGYIVDSNGIYYQMPNNYPTCFVEYGDAYSCGDTHYHGAWTYYNTGNATWETAGTIYTNDIYLHRYNRYDSWPLDTF